MPSQALMLRYASLVAFAESRDRQMELPFSDDAPSGPDCGRGPGGVFAKGNQCQEDGSGSGSGSGETEAGRRRRMADRARGRQFRERMEASGNRPVQFSREDFARVPALSGVESMRVDRPADTMKHIESVKLNFESVAKIATVSGLDSAEVEITTVDSSWGHSGDSLRTTVRSFAEVPGFDGRANVTVSIESGPSYATAMNASRLDGLPLIQPGDAIAHYDLFSPPYSVKEAQEEGERVLREKPNEADRTPEENEIVKKGVQAMRLFGARINILMSESLEEAERSGVRLAYTGAAGRGSGVEGGRERQGQAYKGYSLWPRFGFDAKIASSPEAYGRIRERLDAIAAEGPDSPKRGVLSEESWRQYQRDPDSLTVQQLVENRQGENLWRDFGSSINLTLDFIDKHSLGYAKFQEAIKRAKKAKERGERRAYWYFMADMESSPRPEDFFGENRTDRAVAMIREYRSICRERLERRRLAAEARYASLLAFANARNCGTGAGGFQKGNTCGVGEAAAEVVTSTAKGALAGASTSAGKTAFFPPSIAGGAAVGAAIGAASGAYSVATSPARANKAIKAVGTNDEKLGGLVKGLGGSPKSKVTSSDGKTLDVSVRDKSGSEIYSVSMTDKAIKVTPSGKGSLSDKEIAKITKIAKDNAGRPVGVSVDKAPKSTLSKLADAGFTIAKTAAGGLVAGLVVPTIPALAGTAVEATTGIDIEATGVLNPIYDQIDKLF